MLKLSLWALLAFCVLTILVSTVYVYANFEKIARHKLEKMVFEKSQKVYHLSFDHLKVNLWNKSLTFEGFRIFPDSAKALDPSRKYIFFSSQLLSVSKIDFGKLWRNRNLHAGNFVMEQPVAQFTHGPAIDIGTFNTGNVGKGDTIKLFLLDKISIDTVSVRKARLNLDSLISVKNKDVFSDLSLEAIGFKVGGVKTTNSSFPFDVEDLLLKAKLVGHNLPDSVHYLSAKELSLSLINHEIKVKGLDLHPIEETAHPLKNNYWAEIPEATLRTFQVESLYSSDTISIQFVELLQPTLKIKFAKKAGMVTPLNELDFYQLVSKKMKWVEVEKFSLLDGNISLVAPNTTDVAQQMSGVTIDLFNFRIDSVSSKDPRRVLSSEAFDVKVVQMELKHNDKIHRLIINNLSADTRKKTISTGVVSFEPIDKTTKLANNTYVNATVKSVEMKGFSFLEAYHHQILPMDELIIKQPQASIWIKKNSSKDKTAKSLLLEKLSAYAKGVYVKNTLIDEGCLTYSYNNDQPNTNFFKTNFRFHLRDLSLDSITYYRSDKIFFASDFDISFSHVELNLSDKFHRMTTDTISISSDGRVAELSNVSISPVAALNAADSLKLKKPGALYNVQFPTIKLSGANFQQLLLSRELFVSRIDIGAPQINLETFDDQKQVNGKKKGLYALVSDYLLRLNIGEIHMTDGRLQLNEHRNGLPPVEMTNNFWITMTNFVLDSLSASRQNKLFLSDDIDLTLLHPSFALDDGIHTFSAKEINVLTSRNKFSVVDARLVPNLKSKMFTGTKVGISATLPRLEGESTAIKDLFNRGKLPIGTLTLVHPVIQFVLPGQPSKDKPDSAKVSGMNVVSFSSASVNNFIIQDGVVSLANYENGKVVPFARTEMNFASKGFGITKSDKQIKTNYGDFNIDLRNTTCDFPGKSQTLSVSRVLFDHLTKELMVGNLKIVPTKNGNAANLFSLSIPKLVLQGFNPDQLLNFKKLTASRLVLSNPSVTLAGKEEKGENYFSPYELALYSKIKKQLSAVEIGYVDIVNGNLTFEKDKPTSLKNILLTGEGFRVNEFTDKQSRFLNFDKAEVDVSDLEGNTVNGFYKYHIGSVKLNSRGDFLVSGFNYQPALDKMDFFVKKGFQDDYSTVENGTFKGTGFNFPLYFATHDIEMHKLEAALGHVSIYREKRLQLPPNKFVKLPQQLLREMDHKITIDTAFVVCKKLEYSEMEAGALSIGQIFFTDLTANVQNLTNQPDRIAKSPMAKVACSGAFMDEGILDLKAEFDLSSKNNEFTVEAHCSSMPLSLINPITEPNMRISIKEGFNRDLSLFFYANEDSAVGDMTFSYNDLKISILSEKDGELKKEKFISFLANAVALKSENPKQGKVIEPASFKCYRDKQRSVINYCWKSVFSGIKSTLGIKDKDEKK